MKKETKYRVASPFPKVTVVSVCYNAADSLLKTIKSVSSQIYPKLEYIIVDGGSTDETLQVIDKYKSVITKWKSEPDRGIYDAMNKGIDMASGDWIIFMNAGDVFSSQNSIENVFRLPIDSTTALIYGDVVLDFGKYGYITKRYDKITSDQVPFEVCHQSVFTLTNVLKKIKYDLSYCICADCDSFYKISRMGYKLMYVPVSISIFEVTQGISSKKNVKLFLEHCRIKGEKWYQFANFSGLVYSITKTISIKLLSADIYCKFRYNKVNSRKIYK